MDSVNVLNVLGHGTFGKVYLGERKHNKAKVVIKEIQFDECKQRYRASRNEVLILKSLNHPNVIRYYDSFAKFGIYYIVMEYASKGSLFDHIVKNRLNYFEPQVVMNLFCQILSGLNHIHSKKVVHRDLKSENVFLTGRNADVVKIGDFGISKVLPKDAKTKTIIGTTNYLAPEIMQGKPYDHKSDIWSLGCVLYELCTMEKLFVGSDSHILASVVQNKKNMVNTQKYGQQMQVIMDDMLQINPANRPETINLMSNPDIFPTLHILGTELGCL